MRNNITLLSAIFAMLFVGKIGNIGTLGSTSWVWVFVPLLLDLVVDFLKVIDSHYGFVVRFIASYRNRKVRRIIEDAAKQAKQSK